MKLYKVRDWRRLFESHRTRALKRMDWVAIPNKQDGDGFRTIMHNEDGLKIFGSWVLVLQIASKCKPRGTLIRDSGAPHTAESIARITGAPAGDIYIAMELLASNEVGWLECEDAAESGGNPAEVGGDLAISGDTGAAVFGETPREIGDTRNGMEGNGTEGKKIEASPPAPAKPSRPPTSKDGRDFVRTFPDLIPPQFGPPFLPVWENFCRHCREMGKGITKGRAGSLLDRLGDWGEERSIAAIQFSISKNYTWVYEEKPYGQKQSPAADPLDAIKYLRGDAVDAVLDSIEMEGVEDGV